MNRRGHCPVPKSTFTSFMDEGSLHYRASRYRKALFCFDRAVELQPTNKAALVSRSQCHLRLGDASSALADAEASMDETLSYPKGLLQYAECLYNLGQFEKAMIAFNRGNFLRRDMEGFRLGIQKCVLAIRNSVSDKAATQIEDLEEMIPLIEELESLKTRKDAHCCIRPGIDDKNKAQAKLPKPSKARSQWVGREVLGKMYSDREYLLKFLRRPDIQSDRGLAPELRASALEALNYLRFREEFLRLQNPMYTRKPGLNFNNNMVLTYEEEELKKQEDNRKIKMDAAEGALLANMARIEHAIKIGRPEDAHLECDRTLRQMRKINIRLLPRKAEFMCDVLHKKGIAFEQLKEYDKAIPVFEQEFRVASENHLHAAKARALEYLARSFAFKGAFTEAAEIWETRLTLSTTGAEQAYLLHEIGRCYLLLGKLDIAVFYGNQSYDEAVKINDTIWSMNAKILIGQINLESRNLQSAYENFLDAEAFAQESNNNSFVYLLHDAVQCLKIWIEKGQSDDTNGKAEHPSESSQYPTPAGSMSNPGSANIGLLSKASITKHHAGDKIR